MKTVNGNYSYNGLHQLTSLTFSVPGSSNRGQMTFGYDTQDRLSAISRTMTGFGSLSFDTVNSTYSYDLANRLTGITYTDATKSTTLASFSYGFDAAGEVTSYTGPEGSMTYSYDKTGQLTGVSGAQNATFSFDANGNRNSTGYQTGTNNEMLNDGTFSYTYDHNGSTSTKTDAQGNVWTLTWDYRGRLAEVKEVNSLNQTVLDEKMTYDVFNHVIEVTLNGTVQRWTIFDGDNPYMDLNASGQMTARYITDPGALDVFFAKVTSAGALDWYLTDRLGSIREIVDKMAAVQDQITYGAFGNIVSESNPNAGDRFKWDGGEWDGNAKLEHFGARWYDPATGRWLSQDPLALAPDSNTYRYSHNAPVSRVDVGGLTDNVPTPAGEGSSIYTPPSFGAEPQLISDLITTRPQPRSSETPPPSSVPELPSRPGGALFGIGGSVGSVSAGIIPQPFGPPTPWWQGDVHGNGFSASGILFAQPPMGGRGPWPLTFDSVFDFGSDENVRWRIRTWFENNRWSANITGFNSWLAVQAGFSEGEGYSSVTLGGGGSNVFAGLGSNGHQPSCFAGGIRTFPFGQNTSVTGALGINFTPGLPPTLGAGVRFDSGNVILQGSAGLRPGTQGAIQGSFPSSNQPGSSSGHLYGINVGIGFRY